MVRAAVDAIGGIGRFIQRGDVVVIKPNVAFERPAVLGATTHPEVLTALIHLVREAGARGDPGGRQPHRVAAELLHRTGIQQAAVAAGARVFLPSPGEFETAERRRAPPGSRTGRSSGGRSQGATKVIGVAPVKDHNLCRASMTTKNWYGLLGGRRNQFHQDIHGIIADLALMLRPTFVLLDGTPGAVPQRPHRRQPQRREGRAHRWSPRPTRWPPTPSAGTTCSSARARRCPPTSPSAAARKLGDPDWRRPHVKEVQVG